MQPGHCIGQFSTKPNHLIGRFHWFTKYKKKSLRLIVRILEEISRKFDRSWCLFLNLCPKIDTHAVDHKIDQQQEFGSVFAYSSAHGNIHIGRWKCISIEIKRTNYFTLISTVTHFWQVKHQNRCTQNRFVIGLMSFEFQRRPSSSI